LPWCRIAAARRSHRRWSAGALALGVGAAADFATLHQAGALRLLAVTGTQRAPGLADVPTFAEAGVAGFEINAWNGLLASAGTPTPTIAALHAAVVAALADPDLRAPRAGRADRLAGDARRAPRLDHVRPRGLRPAARGGGAAAVAARFGTTRRSAPEASGMAAVVQVANAVSSPVVASTQMRCGIGQRKSRAVLAASCCFGRGRRSAQPRDVTSWRAAANKAQTRKNCMTPEPDRLALSLLLLLTLGMFFLQWGIEKFVVPATTTAIFKSF
jgi:hypothetical protein